MVSDDLGVVTVEVVARDEQKKIKVSSVVIGVLNFIDSIFKKIEEISD